MSYEDEDWDSYFASRTKICPECEIEFIVPSVRNWVYSRRLRGVRLYYCSYTCWRASEKHTPKRNFITTKNRR